MLTIHLFNSANCDGLCVFTLSWCTFSNRKEKESRKELDQSRICMNISVYILIWCT